MDQVKDVMVTRKEKGGNNQVRTSTELQNMNKADNLAAARQGEKRLEYTDNNGSVHNLSEGIQMVGGRAQYNNNGKWLDANIALESAKNSNLKVNRVKFNSEDYFKLVQRNEANQFLALGRNVKFKLDNEVYEVFE